MTDDARDDRDDDALRRAYEQGADAAARGEEAAPGCTTTPAGRAYLRGFVEARANRAGRRSPGPPGQSERP